MSLSQLVYILFVLNLMALIVYINIKSIRYPIEKWFLADVDDLSTNGLKCLFEYFIQKENKGAQ